MRLVVYQHQWGRREIHTGFWLEKLKKQTYVNINGMILKRDERGLSV
jgi:hypothetical protein